MSSKKVSQKIKLEIMYRKKLIIYSFDNSCEKSCSLFSVGLSFYFYWTDRRERFFIDVNKSVKWDNYSQIL